MVLPVYSGDKNKDGGIKRAIANRLLHARLFITRFKLPIALMVAIVVAVVLFSSPRLPQPPPDVGGHNQPDLRVGIGQVKQGEEKLTGFKPIVADPRPDAAAAAGLKLPSAEQQEKLRQEQAKEAAEQRLAEERAAAERAAAEQQHREEEAARAGNKGPANKEEGETNTGGNGDASPNAADNANVNPNPADNANANPNAHVNPNPNPNPEPNAHKPAGNEPKEGEIRMPETQEEANDPVARERQHAVREAFLHAWRNYEKYAWGFDELRPQSRQGMNWLSTGLGATIVDSLSTMHIMGLRDEFVKARNWIESDLPAHIEAVRLSVRVASA